MVTLSKLYHYQITSEIRFEPEILELRGYPSCSMVESYMQLPRLFSITLSNLWNLGNYRTIFLHIFLIS